VSAKIVVTTACAVGLLVVLVEGADLFTIWNLSPVAGVLAITLAAQRRPLPTVVGPGALALSSFVVLGLIAIAHLAWYFDWGRTATGSSTSALLFVFIPIWAFAAGGVAMVVIVLGRALLARSERGA